MTERRQLTRWHGGGTTRSRRGAGAPGAHSQETVPTDLPPSVPSPAEPSLLGFPAEYSDATGEQPPEAVEEDVDAQFVDAQDVDAQDVNAQDVDAQDVAPEGDRPVVLRRPDAPAGSLLLVAGTAAGMSLFLPWVHHDEELGLALVRQAVDSARTGVAAFAQSGLVLPVVVAGGGVVLFLAGLLAFRPARTHRPTGVVALVVSLAVAAGLVVRAADRDWGAVLTDPGLLCAVVVAISGLLGALKAMLTAPEVAVGPRRAP